MWTPDESALCVLGISVVPESSGANTLGVMLFLDPGVKQVELETFEERFPEAEDMVQRPPPRCLLLNDVATLVIQSLGQEIWLFRFSKDWKLVLSLFFPLVFFIFSHLLFLRSIDGQAIFPLQETISSFVSPNGTGAGSTFLALTNRSLYFWYLSFLLLLNKQEGQSLIIPHPTAQTISDTTSASVIRIVKLAPPSLPHGSHIVSCLSVLPFSSKQQPLCEAPPMALVLQVESSNTEIVHQFAIVALHGDKSLPVDTFLGSKG